MGIEHLNEKELKDIKGMNVLVKILKISLFLPIGFVIYITLYPIVMPFYLKIPDTLLESMKIMFTLDYYYIAVGGCLIIISFYKVTSKLMAIINKLMKSDKEI